MQTRRLMNRGKRRPALVDGRCLLALLLTLVIFVLTGCGVDYQAQVESNTSWTGEFAGQFIEGSGHRTIDLPDDIDGCCVVQKNTGWGYLKIRIIDANGGVIEEEWKETEGAYGYLEACY